MIYLTDDAVGDKRDSDAGEHKEALCPHPAHARHLQDMPQAEQLCHRLSDHVRPDINSGPTSPQDLGPSSPQRKKTQVLL